MRAREGCIVSRTCRDVRSRKQSTGLCDGRYLQCVVCNGSWGSLGSEVRVRSIQATSEWR